MGKIVRIYVSSEVSRGVARSQMFNWAEWIEKKGIHTIFLIFYSNKNKLALMLEENKSDILTVKILKYPIVRQFQIISVFFRIWLRYMAQKKIMIFQTRSPFFYLGLMLIKYLPKTKIIYDIRGAGEDEKDKPSLWDKIKKGRSELRKKTLLSISDCIICVSNMLKQYVQEKYSLAKNKRIEVIYGAAEKESFFFDQDLRENIRNKLNLNGKIVLLYSGHLDKPWQIPEKIFQLFEQLANIIQNLRLIMLTPDIKIADSYARKYKINKDHIILKTASYKELNKFLNCADFSLLLRENKLVNNVASPTKFAEYILSGLPVIITESLGDYSEMVREKNFGVTILDINNLQNDINKIVNYILKMTEDKNEFFFKRKMISDWGVTNLSKESMLEKYYAIMKP